MRYLALASDYDGTLASHGAVAPETLEALRRVAATGRKLILVTGRRIDDLIRVFPELAIFDRVVAETGPLLYRPQPRETRVLSKPPPAAFIEELRRRGVQPVTVGQVFVATEQPNEQVVLEVISELGLDLHRELSWFNERYIDEQPILAAEPHGTNRAGSWGLQNLSTRSAGSR